MSENGSVFSEVGCNLPVSQLFNLLLPLLLCVLVGWLVNYKRERRAITIGWLM